MNKTLSTKDFPKSTLIDLSEEELLHRKERGDFVDPKDIEFVEQLLKKLKEERSFIERCEKASKTAALTAQKRSLVANIISLSALVVSVVSLIITVRGA